MVLLHRIGRCVCSLLIALPFGCAQGHRDARGVAAAWTDSQRTLSMTDGREYDAILSMPHGEPIALAVLFGGGSVTDVHWTVPARVEINGQPVAMTIDGKDTRDADDIARALLSRDIAVFRFSSIHRDDPMAAVNPGMALGIPYPDARAIACAALADAEAIPQVAHLPVVCIGHSLGAARALQCAADDHRIKGFVFLAGAYLTNPRDNPSRVEQALVEELRPLGVDLDSGVSLSDWTVAMPRFPDRLRAMSAHECDFDRDDMIRRWEVAAAVHLAMLDGGDASFQHLRTELAGGPLPSELVLAIRTPTLALFGALDPMAYHGPMLARAAADAGDSSWLTVEYRHDLGHNLSPVSPRSDGFEALAGPTLVGPINLVVCERIADFVAAVARR